jgi:hypothetical protein
MRLLSPVLLLSLLLCGCRTQTPGPPEEETGPVWFEDVTEKLGPRFTHDAGVLPGTKYFLPQIMGSGCAVFDFDNDGRLDIYLIHNGGPKGSKNQLFHQKKDGTFEDVSADSGLDVAGYGMGVAIGDVNNDGLPDVLLTEYGGIRLFINLGGGKFRDVTKEAGLDNPLWAASAAFFDYDRDGWLDLVVVNYLDYDPTKECTIASGQKDYCGPNVFPGTVARLFHNRGPQSAIRNPQSAIALPRFEDVTVKSGLASKPGPGLGVVCADFDGDGWPDIFVANDGKPNHLWINHHDGTFKEEAALYALAYNGHGQSQAGMGIALGDTTGGGLFDVFVTHLTSETHTLWRQTGRGQFEDRTVLAGLTGARWRGTGFGTVLGDFDHDGALDLVIVNGRVSKPENPGNGPFWTWYAERNQLFANDGKGRFRDISSSNEPFCGTGAVSRGLAVGDLTGDGALDLLVTSIAGPARLFRNVAPDRGHWLLVRAIDPALGGRDAYGAEVTVVDGERRWWRLINPGHSYLCSNDARAHFGLGSAHHVDAFHVVWPDGKRETFPGLDTDQVVVLRKGSGTVVRHKP